MKIFFHKTKSLPTATTIQEKNKWELQLLMDAIVQKADAIVLTVNITFNTKEK